MLQRSPLVSTQEMLDQGTARQPCKHHHNHVNKGTYINNGEVTDSVVQYSD